MDLLTEAYNHYESFDIESARCQVGRRPNAKIQILEFLLFLFNSWENLSENRDIQTKLQVTSK